MQLTKELAYLLGALRDGSVLRYKEKNGKVHHYVCVYNKNTEWLKEISRIFEVLFDKKPCFSDPRKGTPYTRIYSKEITEAFQRQFQHPLTSQITWRTPKKIISARNETQKHYIAGFWDAEGGQDKVTGQIRFHLSWNGMECPPLEDIKRMLKRQGIKTGKVRRYSNKSGRYPRFVLRILKKDNKTFFEKIPIRNISKKIGNLTAK